jgi:hypothetical protein
LSSSSRTTRSAATRASARSNEPAAAARASARSNDRGRHRAGVAASSDDRIAPGRRRYYDPEQRQAEPHRLVKTQQIDHFDAEAAASVTTATENHPRGRSGTASGRARPAEPTQHRTTAAI